jgi:hypothetical protein
LRLERLGDDVEGGRGEGRHCRKETKSEGPVTSCLTGRAVGDGANEERADSVAATITKRTRDFGPVWLGQLYEGERGQLDVGAQLRLPTLLRKSPRPRWQKEKLRGREIPPQAKDSSGGNTRTRLSGNRRTR